MEPQIWYTMKTKRKATQKAKQTTNSITSEHSPDIPLSYITYLVNICPTQQRKDSE